jgi:hypothetical protein
VIGKAKTKPLPLINTDKRGSKIRDRGVIGKAKVYH